MPAASFANFWTMAFDFSYLGITDFLVASLLFPFQIENPLLDFSAKFDIISGTLCGKEMVMTPYLNLLKNYINVNDRTSRKDFWMAILIHSACSILTFMLSLYFVNFPILTFIGGWYALATFIPICCAIMRRLRDAGRSTALFLLIILPVVGTIPLIILLCGKSVPADGTPLV